MQVPLPLIFRLPEAILFWAIFIIAFFPEIRLGREARRAAPSPQDAGTFCLIIIGNQIAMTAGLAASFLPVLVIPAPHIAFYSGMILLVLGTAVRRHCFKILGQYFTGVVTASAGQPVIDRGLYRWVRHPSYTGGVLMFSGLGISSGSWLSTAILFLIPCLLYSRRVAAEEKALLDTIGEPYRAYMAKTKRFIPFIV